ncbi:MAG: glycosyltransferase [Gammaproteobacteria bacterium]|nr:MAG: glycosyltransferase [Gammaproteobacteria bacterium]
MQCAIIIPIGPGHQTLAQECAQSVQRAFQESPGPFDDILVLTVDDSEGRYGRSRARNQAVRQAAEAGAEWVFFLDADDLLLPEAFRLVAPYVAHHDAVWGAILENQYGSSEIVKRAPQVDHIYSLRQLLDNDPVTTLQMGHFVKTRVALAHPFDESLDTGEDFDYYLRVWETQTCVKAPLPLFVNRRGAHSTGPRSANGVQWRIAAHEAMNRAKARLEASGIYGHALIGVPAGMTHVFRADATNAGDWWSLPAHYLPFANKGHLLDIAALRSDTPMHRNLVVGGGGLVSPHFPQLEQLMRRVDIRLIGWGLGHNMNVDVEAGYVEPEELRYPRYMERFDLLGVRDWGAPYRWVPCASCLHPAFSRDYPIRHEIVVYEHKRIPTGIDGFPKMTNDTGDIVAALEFLGSGRLVLTNSYHGAYWATLLGRQVIAFPFSSKFYGLKHRIPLCRAAEWEKHVAGCKVYPEALIEGRRANVDFLSDVERFLFEDSGSVAVKQRAAIG